MLKGVGTVKLSRFFMLHRKEAEGSQNKTPPPSFIKLVHLLNPFYHCIRPVCEAAVIVGMVWERF